MKKRVRNQHKSSTVGVARKSVAAQNESRQPLRATASRRSGGHGSRTRNRQSRHLISNPRPVFHKCDGHGSYVRLRCAVVPSAVPRKLDDAYEPELVHLARLPFGILVM